MHLTVQEMEEVPVRKILNSICLTALGVIMACTIDHRHTSVTVSREIDLGEIPIPSFPCDLPATCPPEPLISFMASSDTVPRGQSIDLVWTVKVWARAFIHDSANDTRFVVATPGVSQGRFTVTPQVNTMYTLVAGFGGDECYQRKQVYIKVR
jgi:hypothetical protein